MESNATKPDKDVIYTLRCAHQKQSQLVILADHKAQILSGLALVVLTLLGTRLIFMNTEGLLDSYSNLTILLFILFCVSEIIAITLGIFVVMPNLPTKKKTEIKIENKKISIKVCDSMESIKINKKFRRKNQPTNVLAFPSNGDKFSLPNHLGDILICDEVVLDEATYLGIDFDERFTHLVIHGILHLLGYLHNTESNAR